MKFWESPLIKKLGWKEEPKGVSKVMSVCMLIVISSVFLPLSIIQTKIASLIIKLCIAIFSVLFVYELVKRIFLKK
jgi:hypothetical protein